MKISWIRISRRSLISFLLLIWLTLPLGATEFSFDPTVETPETVESETQTSVPKSVNTHGSQGRLIFFPRVSERPDQGRFNIKTGDIVPVCLKLSLKDSHFYNLLKEQVTGFLIILEDNQSPPNVLEFLLENNGEILNQAADGCYLGKFKIPPQTKSSVYQIADLLYRTHTKSFLSLRKYLYGFSQADELEVENLKEDQSGPQLVKIQSFQPSVKEKVKGSSKLKVHIEQLFFFQDAKSQIDPGSLRIFYRLREDGFITGYYQPHCKLSMAKQGKFKCELTLSQPEPIWDLQKVDLELESIFLKDKAGNIFLMSDPKELKSLATGPIKFSFRGKRKGPPSPYQR